MEQLVTAKYEQELAYYYHQIDQRGLCIDTAKIFKLRQRVEDEIRVKCLDISGLWGCHVFVGSASDDGSVGAINLNSSKGEKSLLGKLKQIGYDVPKVRIKNKEKEIEFKESACDLVLNKLFAENQFKYTLQDGLPGDPAIAAIMEIRELKTLKDRYINARLYERQNGSFFLSNYNVAGTLTGRRSSRKNLFGYGGNAQNFPKHNKLAQAYRECVNSRPGNIFFSVDQISAEDWPVSSLAENTAALVELRQGKDRHRALACDIFNLPWDYYDDRKWKDSIERYLGKKVRHANNYGMRGKRMSDSLAQEGKSYEPKVCQLLLDKANEVDPSIKGVFHNYVKGELFSTRILRTPFGRERAFFGLRPNSDNGEILNEAYAYIPQSTVGDNTGLAVAELFRSGSADFVSQEGHDSILQDLPDDDTYILQAFKATVRAFDRTIKFHNGIEVTIPVEGELGYSLADLVKIKSFTEDGILQTLQEVRRQRQEQEAAEYASANSG